MNKILKIVVAVLSLVGIISFIRIVLKGTDQIEALAAEGDTSIIEPIAWIGYIILGLTLLLVLFFVFRNLFAGGNIKNTLIGVGAFLAVLLIGYLVSGGDLNKYEYDDMIASSAQSRLVGAGLVAFYILSIVAIGSMIFAGVKKLIK